MAQIARALARALRGDEDLLRRGGGARSTTSYTFGHTGEDALNAKMAAWGGFDRNAQSLRIVTRLEQRYAEFDGLNLSWETLEGTGEAQRASNRRERRGLDGALPAIHAYNELHDLELDRFAGIEAQCAGDCRRHRHQHP